VAAPVLLPEGALIVGMDFDACDSSTTAAVTARLYSCDPAGNCSSVSSGNTGIALAAGCGRYLATDASVTVNNAFNNYFFEVDDPTDSTVTKFNAVRVYYKLQVSPNDPNTQTFADVPPSHPFHRFIEALAASGITGGCGGGNFCPNDPITRGQMAVFLAAALGLHWAP
jgi:hypothetical protein